MATSQMTQFIQHLRNTVFLRDGAECTDRQLLEDYICGHDKAALEELVRRHGPMVWGVCRRVLGNHQDAEDAFQATFLVLIRKASSIVSRELIANWLYGVAHQTALKARATSAKRSAKERQVPEMPEPAVDGHGLLHDLDRLLDLELSHLPDKYRAVIVLCDLQGKTRKEAAQVLGVPEGTVASRIATARTMLGKQLARHGLPVSGAVLATMLSQSHASATVPSSVVSSTINAASCAVGQAAGVISPHVATLTEGVMKAMLLNKLKNVTAILLFVICLGGGMGILGAWGSMGSAAVEPMEMPAAAKNNVGADLPAKERNAGEEPVAANQEANPFAWGKEVDGLQAGVGFAPGVKRSYSFGESVRPTIKLRNVSKKATTISYLLPPHSRIGPTVRDAKGKSVAIVMARQYFGYPVPDRHTLQPAEEFNFEIARKEAEQFTLELPGGIGDGDFAILRAPPGKYMISYAGLLQSHPTLSTGSTEIEVKAKAGIGDTPTDKKKPIDDDAPQRKQKMRVTKSDGSPAQFNGVVTAHVGLTDPFPKSWIGMQTRDGFVPLAELPVGTHWLLAAGDSEQRTVFRLKVPATEQVVEKRLRVARTWVAKNIEIKSTVHMDEKDGEVIIVEIRNGTEELLLVSEEDIHLTTKIQRDLVRGLSPRWHTSDFAMTKIEASKTGQLKLNWRDWVRKGLWSSRMHESITEPGFLEAEAGKVWVRVNVGNHGALPVSVTAPSKAKAD